MSKIATKWLEDAAVTEDKINTSAVGDGLTGGAGSAIDVLADPGGTPTISVSASGVKVADTSIDTTQLAGTSVTAAKLGSDVAGDGLTGGNGADLDVDPDTTGGANLATVINVSANGVAVKINDSTIGENGSNQLEIKANSIGPTQIDEEVSYTWITGSHDFTGVSSITVPTPTSDAHAVTKGYADGLRQGVAIKDPCRAMNDANEALTGDPGTVDGVTTWATGERMLLTNQSTGSQNGIWVVDTGGPWSRPTDFDTGDDAAGAQTWINEGTSYGDSQWTCTTDPPNDIIDTDSLVFTQTSGAGQVTAGVGLTKLGNTIRVGDGTTGNRGGINFTADDIAAAVDDSTIAISSNQIIVKALGITSGEIANATITGTQLNTSVAGNGLTGGGGSALSVDPDTTGGANLAEAINVSANGVAVKVDDSTIADDGTGLLEVPDAGITETQLNSSVAGEGITGGAGSALDFSPNDITTAETTPDNADLIGIWDDTASAVRKMTRGNFLTGAVATTSVQEAHLITAGEDTNGYFTLANNPSTAGEVTLFVEKGVQQINKQIVGATGASPDFDLLSSDQIHFNNNGAATGLTEDLGTGDIVFVQYTY